MSRGAVTGKSVARMDALVWLSNVKVGNDNRRSRGGSSGAGSVGGAEGSGESSRVGSVGRGESVSESASENGARKRSVSRSRAEGESSTGTLQDE